MNPLQHQAIQRFQIEHHARTGEILDFATATRLLAEERQIQQLCARDDMIARLEHARRCVGQRFTQFVAEEGYPRPRLLSMQQRVHERLVRLALEQRARPVVPGWLQP